MQEHDAGTITAYRSQEFDKKGNNIVKTYTKNENKQRNKALLAKLIGKYSVTRVKGAYIENYGTSNAKEVGEAVFFVVDINNTGNLEKDLKKLGQLLNQDSILFIPKGTNSATLIGTKKDEFSDEFAYPNFGQKIKMDNAIWGREGEFMTKKNGRPFLFEDSALEIEIKGFFSRWGLSKLAK
jgi:hypothetical protein